jgi:hypothetical protein
MSTSARVASEQGDILSLIPQACREKGICQYLLRKSQVN